MNSRNLVLTRFVIVLTRWLIAAVIGIFSFGSPVHADFRKALDAYIARDGDNLLKEVRDAVDKKNDDGLMLFLMATNMDAAASNYDETTRQSKSTLRVILPQPKWDELRNLLIQATNNSTVDAQYYFNVNSQFSREFMLQRLQAEQKKRGEQLKKEYTNQEVNQVYSDAKKSFIEKGLVPFADYSSASMVIKQAENGDPYAQSMLGFFSLGYSDFTTPPCEEIKAYAELCKIKDEAKGHAWLKKAVKTYEQDGLLNEGYGQFANGMCGSLLSKNNPSTKDLHQAYRWCFMSANLGNLFAVDLLGKMHKSGSLKQVASKLDAVWDTPKRDEILYVKDIKEWPDMVLEARKELTRENTPVFSYLFVGAKLPGIYALSVFSDGNVFIRDMDWRVGYKTPFMKVSPKHVKQFLAELHRMGIDGWLLSSHSDSLYCSEATCPAFSMRVSLRDGDNPRLVNIVEYDEKGIDSSSKFKVRQLAKLKAVVDSYFPINKLIIDLGNSGDRQEELLNHERWWAELAKQGDRK